MINKEANDKLYEKMTAEQDKYRKWLLSLPPQEILNHAYEYTVREDVMCSLEDIELDERDAVALLKSPAPLEDIYKDWQKRDPTYMEDIRDTILDRARKNIQREKDRAGRDR